MKLLFLLLTLSQSINAQPIIEPALEMFRAGMEYLKNPGNSPDQSCPCLENDHLPSPRDLSIPVGRRLFNRRCRNFIQADGSYGPWGREIVNYIGRSHAREQNFFNNEMRGMMNSPNICPNWGVMSEDHKLKFWVWTMASITHVESSCDQTAVNRGRVPNPSDRPRGLLQLNSLQKERRWRGRNCRFPSNNTSPANQIRCGMDIMHEQIRNPAGMYGGTMKIYPNNSYWEKLRPNHSSTGGDIGRLMRMYEPCGAN